MSGAIWLAQHAPSPLKLRQQITDLIYQRTALYHSGESLVRLDSPRDIYQSYGETKQVATN